jgi:polyphosphate kinase
MEPIYFDRDISWLSFNRRVLQEAADESLPIVERIKFLSIFSANLDEFYSVRVPVMAALAKLTNDDSHSQVQALVNLHMKAFGSILQEAILPGLKSRGVHLIYDEPIPQKFNNDLKRHFYDRVAGYLQPVLLSTLQTPLLIENNRIYLLVVLAKPGHKEELALLNIPSDALTRFYYVDDPGMDQRTIFFLEDIIKANLVSVFNGYQIKSSHCIKITRNAELDLLGEFKGSFARKLEKKLKMRAFGPPSRLLYEPGIPASLLESFVHQFGLHHANLVAGGHYHNLKDLTALPMPQKQVFAEESWPPKPYTGLNTDHSIFEQLTAGDLLVNTPFQSFQPILRFFNEAALDHAVKEIWVTIYRVARDSQIINALISAARNGKKVIVFVELKARFDEANNLSWSKKMKAAGVRIVYSAPELKVHSKIALVKRKLAGKFQYFGLFSTGNLNETTAGVYTDHVLLTGKQNLTKELDALFRYLVKKSRDEKHKPPIFSQLLVSPFNLQERFLQLISQEMESAAAGKQAEIIIKLNNLEEKKLIRHLYDASNAGVRIRIIVRGICCLVPGVPGLSDNITVIRIIDRFLEHGRVFIFNNRGNPLVFAGSSDWMNRNIYHRVEVCFPVYEEAIKAELVRLIKIQLSDNVKAVFFDQCAQSNRVERYEGTPAVRSQLSIYDLF